MRAPLCALAISVGACAGSPSESPEPPQPIEVAAPPRTDTEPTASESSLPEREGKGPERPSCSKQPDTAAAESHFRSGVELYAEGVYAAAAKEFSTAYHLSCKPALLFNLGAALERQGQRAAARRSFELYLELEPEPPPARIDEVRRRIEQLED